MADEIRIDVNDIKYVSPGYMIELREQIGDLKRQLAEARAEINRLREKLGWVPAVFDIKALRREAGR